MILHDLDSGLLFIVLRRISMKVEVIVPAVAAESSGPSYSVPGLCRGLAASQVDVTLHVLSPVPKLDGDFRVSSYPRHTFPHPRFGRSPEMLKGLYESATVTDVIHNNSLWMFPNVYSDWAIKRMRRNGWVKTPKIVNAPRGTLAQWSLEHSKWRKKLFGWYAQNVAVAHTDMFHATSQKEYEEIRAGGYKQPVAIVPIGMDLPTIQRIGAEGKRRVAFFGRLHKVKAVDNLILAWDKLMQSSKRLSSDWELLIAGPDCGVKTDLENLVRNRKLDNVRFVGEINGAEKYDFLARADVYVLPSLTENFGITLAEALACGTPCIASHGTPWSGLEEERAGRWIPIGVEPLAEALKDMISKSDDERRLMGERGRVWIERDFSWRGIGEKMKQSYEWLLGRSDRPEWVVCE